MATHAINCNSLLTKTVSYIDTDLKRLPAGLSFGNARTDIGTSRTLLGTRPLCYEEVFDEPGNRFSFSMPSQQKRLNYLLQLWMLRRFKEDMDDFPDLELNITMKYRHKYAPDQNFMITTEDDSGQVSRFHRQLVYHPTLGLWNENTLNKPLERQEWKLVLEALKDDWRFSERLTRMLLDLVHIALGRIGAELDITQRIHGRVNILIREEKINRFQNEFGEFTMPLATTKSGVEGLNIQAASMVTSVSLDCCLKNELQAHCLGSQR
ncbi:hypothetical protein CC78DRAFT_580356 [Lojkania enalia]|uniref:Uncharacterized protein n=1 Tax=Lojkania enalia TaxID=147567 RepID=A0A9P4N6D5_9PLEO|nr:hypothetical protein CC78DRAFT_580356 [Didymosphaeria enalia]